MTTQSSYAPTVRHTQKLLSQELFLRKAKRSGYSLRAFARFLGISPGRLSELLSGRRAITLRLIEVLANKLNLSESEKQIWIQATTQEKKKAKEGLRYLEINPQEVEFLADWQHFAILALMKTVNFKSDAKWISERLRISVDKVNESLLRLEQIGFIDRERIPWKNLQGAITTTNEVASQALRHSHRQYLRQATESLESVELSLRDVTSICMAIDPRRIPQAKKKIARFRRELCDFLAKGKTTEVYRLNIQLFPTSHRNLK